MIYTSYTHDSSSQDTNIYSIRADDKYSLESAPILGSGGLVNLIQATPEPGHEHPLDQKDYPSPTD